jgi:hypothetical protein
MFIDGQLGSFGKDAGRILGLHDSRAFHHVAALQGLPVINLVDYRVFGVAIVMGDYAMPRA